MTSEPPFPLTRETKIRLDQDGVFWVEGQRLGHPSLQDAFARWIDIDPESGRYILKNDVNWAFLTVEDAPFVVRGIDEHGTLTLYDGTTEPLDASTLRIDEDDVVYCDVKGGKLPARFAKAAAFALLYSADVRDGEIFWREHRVRRVPRGEGARRA